MCKIQQQSTEVTVQRIILLNLLDGANSTRTGDHHVGMRSLVVNYILILASESWHKGSNAPSVRIRSPVIDEIR